MHRQMLKSKIHRATITDCDLHYAGSITIDSELMVMPVADGCFSSRRAIPVGDGRAILELKYRGTPPALFKRLVEEFSLTPDTASKYRLGLACPAECSRCGADHFRDGSQCGRAQASLEEGQPQLVASWNHAEAYPL